MDVNAEKIELAQMIFQLRTAKGLADIRTMLEKISAMEFELSPAHKEILDERKRRHNAGESASFTWEEVKADIARLRSQS